MKCGIAIFATDYGIDVVSLARAVEERGFESLFLPEHSHIPTDTVSPWPGQDELPRQYRHTLDPFVSLAQAAAVTTKLLLGTGVCLVVQRDPIALAKEVATLDFLSGGRFLFGIGGGWNATEMRNHGTDPDQRWKLLRERVLAMKAIWTNEVAEYSGELVRFGPMWQWPKPAQTPHPPVLVGGNGPRVLEKVVEYGDGWFPQVGRSLGKRVAELQAMAEAAGRAPLPVTAFGVEPEPEAIERVASSGVERGVFMLPCGPEPEVLEQLDRIAKLRHEYLER